MYTQFDNDGDGVCDDGCGSCSPSWMHCSQASLAVSGASLRSIVLATGNTSADAASGELSRLPSALFLHKWCVCMGGGGEGGTRGVTVSTSAFLACHQCYCAGSSLAWGLNLRAF